MINEKSIHFRKLLAANKCVTGVGARDALEAKLIEQAGFDFVWASGFCISAAAGLPDASILSMKHFLDQARSMREVIDIPIIFDADTGYGNAINVMHTTKLLDEAGMAAMCIEDKNFPKDTSLLAGGRQQLLEASEFVNKIKAAKDAQKSTDFCVIARTEALIAGLGLDEALMRASMYAEAGADLVLIHSKSKDPDEIVRFIAQWSSTVPLVIVPTSYPELTEQKIIELEKVKVVIYANQVIRAAVKATQEVLRQIKRDKGIYGLGDSIAALTDIFDLQGVGEMKRNEQKYL
jgi:phosphoenolpyruvate phosphomutase